MTVDIDEVFSRGGRPMIDFLSFCVMSIYMDPVFRFLVGQYRLQATAERALAIYDVFCHPQSAGRISDTAALSPKDVRLEHEVAKLRQNIAEVQSFNAADPEFLRPIDLPARYLFDRVLRSLESSADNFIERAADQFDPNLSPAQNLPGGKMNAAQRQFVEHIWQPHLRPHLVAAGFWRIANIG